MRRMIVAIIDNKANDVLATNMLPLHAHEATAARMFTDVATDQNKNNVVRNYMDDFDLVQLGTLTDEDPNGDYKLPGGQPAPIHIEWDYRVLMTGRSLRAALDAQTANETPNLKLANN